MIQHVSKYVVYEKEIYTFLQIMQAGGGGELTPQIATLGAPYGHKFLSIQCLALSCGFP